MGFFDKNDQKEPHLPYYRESNALEPGAFHQTIFRRNQLPINMLRIRQKIFAFHP
jgi:hypothetical protein